MSPQPKGQFTAYSNALKNLSARTGTSLPSLLLSFGILHELTSIFPLVGVFYTSRALGVGQNFIKTIIKDVDTPTDDNRSNAWSVMMMGKQKMRGWVEEGDKWAAKVGGRYGMFGYEKRRPGEGVDLDRVSETPGHLAGDVTNAIIAYTVTKALLPLRIGLSMYLSPAFSRGVLDPFRRAAIKLLKGKSAER